MSEDTPSQVLGSLPKTRPHRRSGKRKAKPTAAAETAANPAAPKSKPAPKATKASRLRQPPQPAGPPVTTSKKAATGGKQPASARRKPAAAATRRPASTGADIVGTAVQAAAELAEIGLSVRDRKSTRRNSSHANTSYDVFCLKKKKQRRLIARRSLRRVPLLSARHY